MPSTVVLGHCSHTMLGASWMRKNWVQRPSRNTMMVESGFDVIAILSFGLSTPARVVVPAPSDSFYAHPWLVRTLLLTDDESTTAFKERLCTVSVLLGERTLGL